MYTPFGYISVLHTLTTNLGASYGPRISTAGFEWLERRPRWLQVRLYADLDGKLWQDDFDVRRRGAQAVVPFANRASKMILAGKATIHAEPIKNRPPWFRMSLSCHDNVEGFDRRLVAQVDFQLEDERLLDEATRALAERVNAVVLSMGKAIHVGLSDSRNKQLFYSRDAA